jgi:hypothetical protein
MCNSRFRMTSTDLGSIHGSIGELPQLHGVVSIVRGEPPLLQGELQLFLGDPPVLKIDTLQPKDVPTVDSE